MSFLNEKLKKIVEELSKNIPPIYISPKNVNIISEPKDFYEELSVSKHNSKVY